MSFKPKWDGSTRGEEGAQSHRNLHIQSSKKFPKCDIKLAMAAKSFGVYVKPIEDLQLIESLLNSPMKTQDKAQRINNNTLDNRLSFMANAQDPTQHATPVKASIIMPMQQQETVNPFEDLVKDIGSA